MQFVAVQLFAHNQPAVGLYTVQRPLHFARTISSYERVHCLKTIDYIDRVRIMKRDRGENRGKVNSTGKGFQKEKKTQKGRS